MRFRFCGDLDCPDWILAEINTLARMTSIKMKLICQQVSKSVLGDELDYDKVKKLTSDAKFELGDIKACIAALTFILTSSARHGIDEEVLGSELQQLGLPREHSSAICRVYSSNLTALATQLHDDSLRLNRLKDVRWRVDFVTGSSIQNVDINKQQPEVQLRTQVFDTILDKHVNHQFTLTGEQLQLIISDLKKAASLMETL